MVLVAVLLLYWRAKGRLWMNETRYSHAPSRIIHIGTIGFDQEQVYDAIEKAAMDGVNGKRGLITTMEGRRKGAR